MLLKGRLSQAEVLVISNSREKRYAGNTKGIQKGFELGSIIMESDITCETINMFIEQDQDNSERKETSYRITDEVNSKLIELATKCGCSKIEVVRAILAERLELIENASKVDQRYKIMEWNINQATNKNNQNLLPDIVSNEIIRQNPDIVILTEFAFCNNSQEFLNQTFTNRGYRFYPEQKTKNTINEQNEILVAWRDNLFEKTSESTYMETSYKNNNPNCCIVHLKEKLGNRKLTVAGLRITMAKYIPQNVSDKEMQKLYQEQANLRRKQMEQVISFVEKENTVLIVGDFNNYRRGTMLKNWNISQINCGKKKFTIYTPKGQSIYEEQGKDVNHEFAEDHFIAKNCYIKNYQYDRDFVYSNKQVYTAGKDLSDWETLKSYPDHAILYGDLWL